jgi:hypothetical protein
LGCLEAAFQRLLTGDISHDLEIRVLRDRIGKSI